MKKPQRITKRQAEAHFEKIGLMLDALCENPVAFKLLDEDRRTIAKASQMMIWASVVQRLRT